MKFSVSFCYVLAVASACLVLNGLAAEDSSLPLDEYNVVWNQPSKNENGSMPIGNGDLASNVWVEPNGDLVFYISKSDLWSGNGRLLKLGRVRLKLEPGLIAQDAKFTQELDLKTGSINIQTSGVEINFWIDANRPVIHVEVESDKEIHASATLEVWRDKKRVLKGQEGHSAYGLLKGPPVTVEPDRVLPAKDGTIRWFHRNEKSCYSVTLKNQHLAHLEKKYPDPLMHRTFGGLISAVGMKNKGDRTLVTNAPLKKIHLKIHAHTAQTKTVDAWVDAITKQALLNEKAPLESARQGHQKWWKEFWNRSWIFVEENEGGQSDLPVNAHPWRVGVDSQGHSRFRGRITEPRVIGRALSAKEIATLAASPRSDKTKLISEPLKSSCTVSAWINPSVGERGRILDKGAVGRPDCILLDTHPGQSLRWIVGKNTMIYPNCLKPGQWQHVAATVDSKTGVRRLYLNGKLIDGKLIKENSRSRSPVAYRTTQAYVLQRWITACAGRGKFPIKFNGSLFTVAGSDKGRWDADYRRWGGCYWWQNTRLPYWSMLSTGDYDLMQPLWKQYAGILPLLKERVKTYYKHEGAYFSETMYFWGTFNNANFGWGNPEVHTVNKFVRRYWQSGIELTMMMLDYHDYTGEDTFAKNTLIPVGDAVVTFYDQHYKRGSDGKILFDPAQSLETWAKSKNPTPVIVGLKVVLGRLLKLDTQLTTPEQRKMWQRMRDELPAIPIKKSGDKQWIVPGETYSQKQNSENTELYAVFPYRYYGLHKPDLEIARETWRRRSVKGTGGWRQDSVKAALLGLTNEAKNYVVSNASRKHSGSRFPAFWGPNFDWIPDQDHGSVTMLALQRMLIQSEGKKIHLLPAWPKDWNANFKMHAPYNTTIEGSVKDGKIVNLTVTPAERRKDVIIVKAAN